MCVTKTKYLFFIISILNVKTILADNLDLYKKYENQYKAGFLPTPDVPIAAGIGGVVRGLANTSGQLIRNGGTSNFSFSDLGRATFDGAVAVGGSEFGPGPASAVWARLTEL